MADTMKYSIPKNYSIVEDYNGLKGIARKDKNETKLLWDHMYRFIAISKTYGKIIVAHLSQINHLNGEDFLRIVSFNGREQLVNAKVYDLLMGENVLLIKTIRKSTGTVEWCRVGENFSDAQFLGDFEIMGRNPIMKFHLPIGTEFILVKTENGETKRLLVHKGEFVEYVETKPITKVEISKVQPTYDIEINDIDNNIQANHVETGETLLTSRSIGEINVYKPIIEQLLGGFTNVPREKVANLFKLIDKLDHYGNALLFINVMQYVKEKSKKSMEELLPLMIEELQGSWKFKVYFLANSILALNQTSEGKIITAPYTIDHSNTLLEEEELGALVNCYDKSGCKAATLSITEVTEDEEITDHKEMRNWPTPYSVRQRTALLSDIKESSYKSIDNYTIVGDVTDINGVTYGKMELHVGICKNFSYVSKKKSGGNYGEWITTSTCHAALV